MVIVFLCPPAATINGGIKHIFRMAEALIAQGRDAVVFEPEGRRPPWFASTAPVIGPGLTPASDHIYVLPEDQPQIMAEFAALPQRKIVYAQNHFYGALGLGPQSGRDGLTYAAFGITDSLCSSRTIYDHCRRRHPDVRAHIVPCAVDRGLFRPGVKRDMIACMPRKRRIEAAYLRDMFYYQRLQARRWDWVEIDGVSEAEAARLMGEARVFLSLSRMEGLGLTPLEAMAAGCVVTGFTGGGGRDYATAENGYWSAEDDFDDCLRMLGLAEAFSATDADIRVRYDQACAETLAGYTPEVFAGAVKTAWDAILQA